MISCVCDRIVVAGLSERRDAEDRIRPEEFLRFVACHEQHAARGETLFHPHCDCAARDVFKVSADSFVARRVDCAREGIDRENGVRQQ